jgi:hypothetical protein
MQVGQFVCCQLSCSRMLQLLRLNRASGRWCKHWTGVLVGSSFVGVLVMQGMEACMAPVISRASRFHFVYLNGVLGWFCYQARFAGLLYLCCRLTQLAWILSWGSSMSFGCLINWYLMFSFVWLDCREYGRCTRLWSGVERIFSRLIVINKYGCTVMARGQGAADLSLALSHHICASYRLVQGCGRL